MALHVILYVEDEESDVILLRYALRKANVANPLQVVGNGEQAVAYLSGHGEYADREKYPLPQLVLLDLNLPRLDGKNVLKWIRQQAPYAHLPVVIYTSSNQPKDYDDTKELSANDYIVKTSSIDKITEIMARVKARWLNQV